MQDRAHATEVAAHEALAEIDEVEIVGDLAVDEVVELVGLLQIVDRDDLGLATFVQALDEIAADKTGCAGDDVHKSDEQVSVETNARSALRRNQNRLRR